jgi:AAA family ATP:ADP antiporter
LIFWGLFALDAYVPAASRAFFVWTSVFNLFVVSVFWSFMVDTFSKAQAKRLFGMIAAGGTLGTIAGSGITLTALEVIETRDLLLISAGFLTFSLVCIVKLLKLNGGKAGTPLEHRDTPIGGAFYAGFRDIFKNPYLLGIACFICLYSLTATFLYFQQATIVSDAFQGSADRTRVFAFINLSVSVLTVVIQMLLTGRFVRRFGVRTTLLVLPTVSLIGFFIFSLAPVLGALIVFQVVNRTSNFAFTRPAREMLFSPISEEQKYKAKNVIDTVVYRGSDAFSGWLYAALSTGLGLGLSALAVIAGVFAILWAALAWKLGSAYEKPAQKTKEAMI